MSHARQMRGGRTGRQQTTCSQLAAFYTSVPTQREAPLLDLVCLARDLLDCVCVCVCVCVAYACKQISANRRWGRHIERASAQKPLAATFGTSPTRMRRTIRLKNKSTDMRQTKVKTCKTCRHARLAGSEQRPWRAPTSLTRCGLRCRLWSGRSGAKP